MNGVTQLPDRLVCDEAAFGEVELLQLGTFLQQPLSLSQRSSAFLSLYSALLRLTQPVGDGSRAVSSV